VNHFRDFVFWIVEGGLGWEGVGCGGK